MEAAITVRTRAIIPVGLYGGMLMTNDGGLLDRALFLRDHGRVPGDTGFQNSEVAHNYRMSALQAAVGLAQTERAEEWRRAFEEQPEELGTKILKEMGANRSTMRRAIRKIGRRLGLRHLENSRKSFFRARDPQLTSERK